MAIPAAVTAAQAAQATQAQEATVATPKQAPSKFDQALKAQAPQGTEVTPRTLQSTPVQPTAQLDKTAAAKLSPSRSQPVTAKAEASKSTRMMTHMLADIDKGAGVMDKLIHSSLGHKNISNGELLSLQAGMYKYTQELELTGKVVEKATTGLKDTLKTQV